MRNKSEIPKQLKIKLLHGTEDASNVMVGLSEIVRFHSDIAFRKFYQTEYPKRHATMNEIVIASLYGIYLLKMKESSETMHEQGDFKYV